MQIHVFHSDDAPAHLAYLARIETGSDYLPVAIHAESREAATEEATAFWDAELERFAAKERAKIKRAAGLEKHRAKQEAAA